MRVLVPALISIGLLLSLCCRSLPAGEEKDLKIGVVDLKKVFNDYKKKKDKEVDLQKERNELQGELDKKEKELKNLQKELEILEGDEKEKKRAEYDDKKEEFVAFYEYNNDALQTKQVEIWNTIYNEIIEEIEDFGKKGAYDLILTTDTSRVKGKSLEEITLRVDIKAVLYHSPKVDLTEQITKTLNDQYKKLKESKEKSS